LRATVLWLSRLRAGMAVAVALAAILSFSTDKGDEPMSKYTELDTDLLLLAAEDSERSRQKAAERIRAMTPKERRDLRAACQRLDNLVDDVWLEELREKRRPNR